MIHGVGLPDAIMKTRIRRLYDIANILQSLKLIQKVQVTEMHGGKKPAFQYIGPSVDGIGKIIRTYEQKRSEKSKTLSPLTIFRGDS